MRRPLVLVGFCYLLTLAAAVSLGANASAVLFGCSLLLFAVSLLIRRTRAALVFPAAFLTAAVAFGSFAGYSRAAVEPPQALDGLDAEVEGAVCELPYAQYGRWYYIVQLDSVSAPGAPQSFKIRLSAQNALDAEPYSRIRGRVHLFLPQGGNGYNSRSYYASKGIPMFAYLYEYEAVEVSPPQSKPPYYYALVLRRALLSSVDTMLPSGEAALVRGIFLGATTALSADAVSDFRTDGVSHLLSVSGLHMATVAQLLILLFGFLRLPKKLSPLLAGAGVFCFMAVTGFVPPVVRSGIMCLLVLLAPLFSRRADPLNSLGAAALILCVPNPYAAADVGLLLSFSATLGLILLSGPIQRRLNARLDRFRPLSPLVRGADGVLATSAAAILFTLPVVILSFGTVSLVAPLANLLMLFPSTLMIGCSAAGAVVGLFAPHSLLQMPFALLSGLLAKYLLACARFLARSPFASVSASYGFICLWLAGSLVLFAAAFLMCGRRPAVLVGILSAAVLLTGGLSFWIDGRGATRVAVLDAGTGLSVVLTRDGRAAAFGCGGYDSNAVPDYLSGNNIRRLDELRLLTGEREEAVNSAGLSARFAPARLTAPPDSRADGYVQRAAAASGSVSWAEDAPQEQLWRDVAVQALRCGDAEAVRIETRDVELLLLPAEADASLLPEGWRAPDFLVTDGPPDESGELRPVCTVLAMEGEDLRGLPSQEGKNAVWTGGFGDIVLEFKGDRELEVRREV